MSQKPTPETDNPNRPEPRPLGRTELDELRCKCGRSECADQEIFLNPKCHIDAPVKAAYDQKEGVIRVYCFVCQRMIVKVKVAANLIDA